MSAQTGTQTPRGPASERLGDRVRFRFARFLADPNPLWMREMRQSTRLLRTPVILMIVTLMVTLLMSSLGGMMTGSKSPAKAGAAMFQVYFSVAWLVVTLVGPALAANSIASEREGKTWEAVLLTGMTPDGIARGKLMAAYTDIVMYVVMLAPVGALPFLFGGVTPIEVALAFVLLLMVALLGVTFGLAVSAKMQSMRAALLITLLVAVPLSGMCYGLFGVGLSELAHHEWHAVPREMPVWLPLALARVPFGWKYLVFLVLLPLTSLTLSPWLLYEITRANLASSSDDCTYGLKRWYVVAAALLALAAAVPIFTAKPRDFGPAHVFGMACYCMFVTFCAFLFAGEPIGPSRRVHAMLAGASRLRRVLGPGVITTTRMQMIGCVAALGGLCALGVVKVMLEAGSTTRADKSLGEILVFALYGLGFSLFLIGLSGYVRARASSALVPRVVLLVVIFSLSSGPWILAAITGIAAGSSRAWDWAFVVAAPSPAYAFVAIDAIDRGKDAVAIPASIVASLSYAVLGLVLGLLASRRARAVIDEHDAVLAEADRRLALEDVALGSEQASVPSPADRADAQAATEVRDEDA